MATGLLYNFTLDRFTGANGLPVSALVHFYFTGTTNPAVVYSDRLLTIPMSNPVSVAAGAIIPTVFLDPDIAYRCRVIMGDGSVQDSDPVLAGQFAGLAGPTGASLIGEAGGGTVQSELTSLDADVAALEAGLADLTATTGTASEARFKQLLYSNLYLQNNLGGGVNILGDSISHGAHADNAYTNHWPMLLARAIGAEFDSGSIGFIPMEHVFNFVGAPYQTKQIHDVTFSGTDWGPRSANPAPYDYPLGNFGPTSGGLGLGGENIVNGKSYSSSVNGATITIVTVPLTATVSVLVTQKPGNGVINVTVNGVAGTPITTSGPLTYNVEKNIPITDNGKGSCTIILTKADSNPVEINAVLSYKAANVSLTDLARRMTVNNFSQSGRTLSDMNEANIIRACNAPCLIMSLGYNDWSGYLTDSNNTAFAKFQQRINWLIQYAKVYKTLIVVQDFLWYASRTGSRTRAELKRLADEVKGIYIPYPDQFFADGTLPIQSPPQLNDPLFLWADTAHPGPLGNELIFSTLSAAMGLGVRSKRQALEYYDWAWPINITHADWANETPANIRTISTVQQQGKGYRFRLNLDYTAAPTAPAGLYIISTGISPKYRNGVSPAFMFETEVVSLSASDVFYTESNFSVGLSAGTALVAAIKKTKVVEGTA